METKEVFEFQIIINVSVSSFWFIWIGLHIIWVYGHHKYFNSSSAGIDIRRQNLTIDDSRVHDEEQWHENQVQVVMDKPKRIVVIIEFSQVCIHYLVLHNILVRIGSVKARGILTSEIMRGWPERHLCVENGRGGVAEPT